MQTQKETKKTTVALKLKKNIKRILLNIAGKIRDNYHPEKIILFGSYAYGTPTEDSDIDIVVIKKENRDISPIDRSIEIRRILADENRQWAITPIVYTPKELEYRLSIGDDFVAEILEKGKVLYAR
ncbi:MAG: nucleotidyltransferase domain-containing protein [Nitrospirae bacterium]|nr:nucleotidyltransferase domain-containing protein [Nitrospirota bacterium]